VEDEKDRARRRREISVRGRATTPASYQAVGRSKDETSLLHD